MCRSSGSDIEDQRRKEKDEIDYLSALEMEVQVANIAGR